MRYLSASLALFVASCLNLLVSEETGATTIGISPNLNTQTFTSSTELKTATTDVVAIGVHSNGSSGPIRSFQAFDLSAIPAGNTITDVTFDFNTQNNQGTLNNDLVMVALDTSFEINTSVSWTSIDGVNSWTTGGGDIGTTLGTLSDPWSNGSAYNFPSTAALVSAVQSAYDAGDQFQALLYMPQQEIDFPTPPTGNGGGFIRIHARNNPTLGNILNVTYEAPVPEPSCLVLLGLGIPMLLRRRRRTVRLQQVA